MQEIANIIEKIMEEKKSERFCSDKGTEKDSDFQDVFVTEGKHSQTTETEVNSTFAERDIRSLRFFIYRYSKDEKT